MNLTMLFLPNDFSSCCSEFIRTNGLLKIGKCLGGYSLAACATTYVGTQLIMRSYNVYAQRASKQPYEAKSISTTSTKLAFRVALIAPAVLLAIPLLIAGVLSCVNGNSNFLDLILDNGGPFREGVAILPMHLDTKSNNEAS